MQKYLGWKVVSEIHNPIVKVFIWDIHDALADSRGKDEVMSIVNETQGLFDATVRNMTSQLTLTRDLNLYDLRKVEDLTATLAEEKKYSKRRLDNEKMLCQSLRDEVLFLRNNIESNNFCHCNFAP